MSGRDCSKDRPTFTLVIRPDPHVANPIRALRRLLKFALRPCGSRAASVTEAPQ
jgi:hypothetical protein